MSAPGPRAEADARLGGRYDPRVLEPSPPAVDEAPWFADDPLAPDGSGRPAVLPFPSGDPAGEATTWAALAARDPDLADWARERWLGPYPRLGPLPPCFAATRDALHAVAEETLKPAREAANGKIGLRFTRDGFGTPYFGAGEQLRVEGTDLVRVAPGGMETHKPLGVDPAGAGALAAWFGFAASVLEELRAGVPPEETPSRVQLWPEHFDLAVDFGSEAESTRANYGCSPGDADHPEPYCYVGPWASDGFTELGYAQLLAAADQRAAALAFFLSGR